METAVIDLRMERSIDPKGVHHVSLRRLRCPQLYGTVRRINLSCEHRLKRSREAALIEERNAEKEALRLRHLLLCTYEM
jgi:hypothetical protein